MCLVAKGKDLGYQNEFLKKEALVKEKYPAWKMIDFQQTERKAFLEKRKAYLLDYPM